MNLSQYISNQFSNPSGIGGNISTFIMNTLNKIQYKAVIERIDTKEEDKVLDIGFGNGYLIKRLALKNKGTFYGIDISEDMVKKAINNSKDLINKNRISLCNGNVMNIPYEDNTFDFSYTVNTVYFWPNLEKGLLEVKRTLKQGGIFMNVIYSKEWLEKISYIQDIFKKYTLEELKERTEDCGFNDVKIVEIKKGKAYCVISIK